MVSEPTNGQRPSVDTCPHVDAGVTVQADGCVRCSAGGLEARHLVRNDDGSVSCGSCGRCLVSVEECDAIEGSLSRACLAVTNGQEIGVPRQFHRRGE